MQPLFRLKKNGGQPEVQGIASYFFDVTIDITTKTRYNSIVTKIVTSRLSDWPPVDAHT